MSGIAGIIHFDGKPVEPGLIEKMTCAMAHRGPDGINHWVKGSVALGQCMLRTTPESLEEYQPLTNEDESLVLVMDGRVDNWEELRRELLGRGAVLRSRADAELVLRAFEIWGYGCLAHINGDFALVIWDVRRQEAFCARDRMGHKPFNYHWSGSTFVFASELHTILALPWMSEILNEGMLAEFLANRWYSRDETFWQGIMRLVAAHRMVLDTSGPCLEQYWAPDLWATLPYTKDEEYIEHYRELFTDVVRRMSRSFRSISCEVSGGLDSSAIFAVTVNLDRQSKLPAPGIQGYALDFHDDHDANELEFSREVGRHLGQQIKEIFPTKKPLSWYQDWARFYREFPGYPNGVMGLGIRREAAYQGSRALLVGVGGDEWLCGSRIYYAEALAKNEWKTLFTCLDADRRDVGLLRSLSWIFRYGCYPLLPDTIRRTLRKSVIGNRIGEIDGQAWLMPAMRQLIWQRRDQYSCLGSEVIKRAGQRKQKMTLLSAFLTQTRELEERLAASVGIELRRPFFDSHLVQLAFSIPERFKLRGWTDKYLHRRAMTGLLPQTVLMRETKADFTITFRWHLSKMERFFIHDAPYWSSNFVDSSRVATLYNQIGFIRDSSKLEWMLWTLFGCKELILNS